MSRKEYIAVVIIFFSMVTTICVASMSSDGREIDGRPATNTTTTTTVTSQTSATETTTTNTTTQAIKKTTKKITAEQPETKVTTTTAVQEYVEPETVIESATETAYIETEATYYSEPSYVGYYSPYDLQTMGVITWGGYRYTYYSELVLPGDGLAIEGRHVDEYGFVCDGNGYICVASSSLPWGTVVDTPFGRQGMVYDSGCAWDVIDCYVHW